MIQLMQALFSTMQETVQQPMTDFRRLCLVAEEKKELDVAPADMDDGQQPENPFAGDIKSLEAEYGPFVNGMSITVELKNYWSSVQGKGVGRTRIVASRMRSIKWVFN